MKVVIDKETCTGCGLCVSCCPEVFEMQDNIAGVKANPIPESSADCAREAVESCPLNAISID